MKEWKGRVVQVALPKIVSKNRKQIHFKMNNDISNRWFVSEWSKGSVGVRVGQEVFFECDEENYIPRNPSSNGMAYGFYCRKPPVEVTIGGVLYASYWEAYQSLYRSKNLPSYYAVLVRIRKMEKKATRFCKNLEECFTKESTLGSKNLNK